MTVCNYSGNYSRPQMLYCMVTVLVRYMWHLHIWMGRSGSDQYGIFISDWHRLTRPLWLEQTIVKDKGVQPLIQSRNVFVRVHPHLHPAIPIFVRPSPSSSGRTTHIIQSVWLDPPDLTSLCLFYFFIFYFIILLTAGPSL